MLRSPKPLVCLLWALTFSLAAPSLSAGQPEASPQVNDIVTRMEAAMEAGRARIPAHTVRRVYTLFDADGEAKGSRVAADVDYLSRDARDYRIVAGSGRAKRVVKKILENEQESAKRQQLAQFSRENYEFQLAGEAHLDGRLHYILEITPRREEKYLLKGRLWVDQQTFLVRRAVGSTAKNPSWWVKSLELTLEFRPLGQAWVHYATDAVAEVRIFGRHYLKSRDVSYRAHSRVAKGAAAVVGAGVIR